MGIISLSKVANMASEKKPKARPADRRRSVRDRAVGEAPAAEPVAEQPAAATAWREQAAFHVTLDHTSDAAGTTSWQTHAYHEETGDERVLPGVLDQAVIGWMRERAGLPTEAQAEPAAEAAPAPAADPAAVEAQAPLGLSVGALDVIEIAAETQAGGEMTNGRLCAQVTFDLSGTMAYLATAALRPYTIQIVALDVQSAAAVPLASLRRDLQPELLGYAEQLDLDVPPVGSYQLIANVVLSDDDTAAVALGPVLHVVP